MPREGVLTILMMDWMILVRGVMRLLPALIQRHDQCHGNPEPLFFHMQCLPDPLPGLVHYQLGRLW